MKIAQDVLTNAAASQRDSKIQPVKVDNLSTEQLTETLQDYIYHKDEDIPSSENTYDNIKLTVIPNKDEYLDEMVNTINFGELPKKLVEVRDRYEHIMGDIQRTSPDLAEKNWGFSIDAENKIVVSGNVTDDEKHYLESKFNADKTLVSLTNEIPDIFMKGQELDRGEDGKGKYWGKYDVTQENFKDVVDIKQLINSSYGPMADMFDDGIDMFAYQDNLLNQLKNKAEVKYGY